MLFEYKGETMNKSMKSTFNVTLTAFLAAMTMSPVAGAYDTDIYFSNIASGSGVNNNHSQQPNILFILDTSGSMQWNMSSTDSRSRMSVLKNSMNTLIDNAQNVNMGIMRFSYEGGAVSYPVADVNADAGLVESQQTNVPSPVIPKGPFTINRSVQVSNGDAKEVVDLFKAVVTDSTQLPASGALAASNTPTTVTKTISVRVENGDDDGVEQTGLNRYGVSSTLTGNTLETPAPLAYNNKKPPRGTSYNQFMNMAGFRFVNLDIPPNAQVTDARLKLKNKFKTNKIAKWLVTVDKNPKSAPFITTIDHPTARVYVPGGNAAAVARNKLTAQYYPYTASWAPNGFYWRRDDTKDDNSGVTWRDNKVKNVGNISTSPNLSDLINEVIHGQDANLYNGSFNWEQGNNAISLFLWPQSTTNKIFSRQFYSRNDSATSSPELKVTYEYDGIAPPVIKDHIVGFNFQDLRVPQGAKILSARLEITAGNSSDNQASLKMYAEQSNDALSFTNVAANISSRSLTSGVNWNIAQGEGWIKDDSYSSPDLAALVQTVVDRSGWCGGNAMSLVLKGAGDRAINSFDAGAALAPKLVVEYENDFSGSDTGCTVNETSYQINASSGDADENNATSSVNTSSNELRFGSDHWAGFNFNNVQVPSGAEVQGAYLSLTANEAGVAGVTIYAHDTDNSEVFSSTSDNISTRTRTTASKLWSASAAAAGDSLMSPDISSLIGEVVSLPTWVAGGGMSILLRKSSGSLKVKSFENNAFDSARLILRYKYELVSKTSGASGITVRQRLKEVVNDLPASGGTPATDTLYEAIRYLKGDTVEWGHQRMPSWARYSNNTGSTKRLSIAASYSPLDASVSIPSGCPGRDATDKDCAGVYINSSPLPKYVSPIVNSCQNTYVVLLSDGDPNSMVGESKISALTGRPCSNDNDIECGQSLATYMSTEDILPTALPGDQNVILHTIRFADDADEDYLKALATAGGGEYYAASNETKLLAAFEAITGAAIAKPQTFAAPSVALSAYNRLQTGSNLFYSMFLPHRTKRWEGNVKHYRFDPQLKTVVGQNKEIAFANDTINNDAQSYWSSPSTIDGDKVDSGGVGERIVETGYVNRNMYTYTGGGSPSNVSFVSGIHSLSSSNSLVTTDTLWGGGMTLSERQNMVDWVRGKDLDDTDGDGSKVDTRWVLSDPLHTEPVSITYNGGADENDSSDDDVKVFVGTNGGVLHAIDGATGEELWAFMPTEMLPKQKEMRNDANGTHIFGIDGRVSVLVKDANQDGDISTSSGDKVMLYMPFGRGARALYALDVTNPNAPKIAWKIDNSTTGFSNLGQTWSKPAITKMKIAGVQTQVLVMGGGYDPVYNAPSFAGSASMGRGVYIIDALSGQKLLWIADSPSADLKVAGMNSAIPSDIRVTDVIGPDGLMDRLYFGDLLGRLWRVDLDSVSRNNPGNSIAHMVADLNGPGEEAGRRFFNPPLAVPFSDTGSVPTYIYLAMVSGDIHNPLYENTLNAAFAVKDTFELLKSGELPDLLTLVKGEANAGQGILDVTTYETPKKPEVPNGYYFNLVDASSGSPMNVGRDGLASGVVQKVGFEGTDIIDFEWRFDVYDPSVNSSTPADACSSSVVGETTTYYVLLKDGFPSASVGDDGDGGNCYNCTNVQEDRYSGGIPGIAPESTEAGAVDDDGNVTCIDISGFTILTPGGKPQCSGANTHNTFWWRSR
jgi:type IV pilus assembly protein PilY1